MATWPALSWEDQLWMPVRRAFGTATDRYTSQPERYRSAVPAAIAARTPALDRETQRLAEGAAIELSRFDAELGERIATFAPVLLRSEAAASSRIENLTASARQILTAELGARAGRNATEIVANTRAMQAAIDLADTVNAAGIRQMHAVLMEGQSHHTPGRWREEPVWIGTRSDSPIGADYVAPEHTLIGKLMDDLVEFMQRFDLPALVTVSIAHAQFETIHPFTDGNGRTGRALAQSLLRHRQITRNVAVPVSAGLLADVGGYHHALTAYRAGDPAPIVRSFADASWRAVENARALVTELDALRIAWGARVAARRDSGVWQLLDVLVRRPVLDARAAAQELGVHVPNVYPHLNKLAGVGILRRKTEHEFGPVWRADEALAAVDAFAERAGRRARS